MTPALKLFIGMLVLGLFIRILLQLLRCQNIGSTPTSSPSSICTISATSNGWYNYNTYAYFYLNGVQELSSAGSGINLVTFSSTGYNCDLVMVGAYYGFENPPTYNAEDTELLAALDDLNDGDVAIIAVTDTASGFSAAVIASLQSNLGATVTTFGYRYSYVLIGQKPGNLLCEQLPATSALTCSVSVNMASFIPSVAPIITPTVNPTINPSSLPTKIPSNVPSAAPTRTPSTTPTLQPSRTPSFIPSMTPSDCPTLQPSRTPSIIPSMTPSVCPTLQPSSTPSIIPSMTPSVCPTLQPSSTPSFIPSMTPSDCPTLQPSRTPSFIPSMTPSVCPTLQPSSTPSIIPSMTPSVCPTLQPSSTPSIIPSMTPSVCPTLQPSSTPSIIPSMIPSDCPTLQPSTYPTFKSRVRVYFMVTQVFSGISVNNYSENKESNDAILKQIVVSMLGYDSMMDDITIQLVTDAVHSRSLSIISSETTVEETLLLIYSVSTPTRFFNDTTKATTKFIQVLNDSITTGAFDNMLHKNTNNNSMWQSVTTVYAIFSTASPTSSPTSTPTSAPTKIDIISANILSIPLDGRVVKEKINYYLGTYVGYFLSIYICLYLFSFLRYGKTTATKLYDTSFQSEAFIINTSNEVSSTAYILSDLVIYNMAIQSTLRLEEELKIVKTATNNTGISSTGSTEPSGNYSVHASISAKLASFMKTKDEDKYSKGYREYLHQQRTLLGCSPFLYPSGYAVRIPCTSIQIGLPPGRFEDILLFICHNHPLFSCFYFVAGSKLGAHGTRILYIGKDMAVFVLYQFSNMLLQYFKLDGFGLGIIINLFVITPSAVSIGLLLKNLYTCPFTETVDFQRRYARYQSFIIFVGRLAILPIMVIMFGFLIIACLFSSNRHVIKVLIDYFMYVQCYGVILAIVKVLLLFVDNNYHRLSLFGRLNVLCVGQLYKESLMTKKLVMDVDFAYRIHIYLFGLIKMETILNRDDAIKAKWITTGGVTTEEKLYNIEMTGADSGEDFVAFGVSNNNDDEAGGYDVYINNSNDKTLFNGIATENPIHSGASGIITTDNSYFATHHQQRSLRLQPLAVNNGSGKTDAIALAEDDAALYLEYRSLQDNHDDRFYDMVDDNEVAMSFDEWKSRRKFKQGTRGSFVKAFQAFEEREQLTLDRLQNPSSSVRNTMKLHGNNVQNVLSVTSSRSIVLPR